MYEISPHQGFPDDDLQPKSSNELVSIKVALYMKTWFPLSKLTSEAISWIVKNSGVRFVGLQG